MKKLVLVFSVATLSILTACGGSGGSNSAPIASEPIVAPTMATGQFVDSPVQGLTATSGNTVSVTDANGQFAYEEGKPVTFSLGGIVFGSTVGGVVVTPTTLDANTTDVTSARATNVLRLLQTLDADGDPSNGITLSDSVRQAAKTLQVDFSTSTTAFEADSKTQYAVSVLTQHTSGKSLVSAEQAQAHYRTSMVNLLSGEYRVVFNGSSNATLNFTEGKLTAVTGTSTSAAALSGGRIEKDGTVVLTCTNGLQSTDCMGLTVSHTDGSTAKGAWQDLTAVTQGQFTAEHFVHTPRPPACAQMAALCQ